MSSLAAVADTLTVGLAVVDDCRLAVGLADVDDSLAVGLAVVDDCRLAVGLAVVDDCDSARCSK